ncbi:MAG: hypothetical protein O3A00_13390 [Planctomycetota bacterium]|nr:hypothetical protein [Planctomycetota bacterium]
MPSKDAKDLGSSPKATKTPPIQIPLNFDDAIDGLLQVDPKRGDREKKKPDQKH